MKPLICHRVRLEEVMGRDEVIAMMVTQGRVKRQLVVLARAKP